MKLNVLQGPVKVLLVSKDVKANLNKDISIRIV